MNQNKTSTNEKNINENLVEKFGFLRSGIITLIRVYQIFLSPIVISLHGGGGCRFFPSCSEYSLFCFRYLSLYKAFYLSIFRILRCNPYTQGGFDEPPKWFQYDARKNYRNQNHA